MKQPELNRLLNTVLKSEAKTRGWKSIAGFLYWKQGDLFFVFLVAAIARPRALHSQLFLKWFSLDDLLWRILRMQDNSRRVSLRANGAFSLPGETILESVVQDCDWSAEWLESNVHGLASAAAAKSAELVDRVASIDDYLALIEGQHAATMARYPGAAVNLWMERILVALEKGDRRTASDIANARIAANDSGKFHVGGRTFYQNVLEYLNSTA